jgi:hypothetical protein
MEIQRSARLLPVVALGVRLPKRPVLSAPKIGASGGGLNDASAKISGRLSSINVASGFSAIFLDLRPKNGKLSAEANQLTDKEKIIRPQKP